MIKVKSVKKILIGIAVLAFFLLRPMAFGNEYSEIGLLLLLGVSLIVFSITKGSNNLRLNFKIFRYLVVASFPIVATLLFAQNPIGFQAVLITLITGFSLSLLFCKQDHIMYFFSFFSLVITLICASAIITYILSLNGSYESFLLKEFEFERNKYIFSIYYPFSVIYTEFNTGAVKLLRFSHFFVEPGIAPSFISAVLLIVIKFEKKKFLKWIKIFILLTGIILTFSTAIFPVLGIGMLFFLHSRSPFSMKKIIFSVILIAISYLLFLKVPYFGFADKSVTHGSSFEDRITYWNDTSENFVKFTSAFVCIILLYLVAKLKNDKWFFYAIFTPILATGFINVVWLTPLFIAFLFYDYSEKSCSIVV